MDLKDASVSNTFELRPIIGLTRGLPTAEVETLTINAIRLHRQLVEKADELFQALPEEYQTGKCAGGENHLQYIEAMIEMHAQINVVNTLVAILGFIPSVCIN